MVYYQVKWFPFLYLCTSKLYLQRILKRLSGSGKEFLSDLANLKNEMGEGTRLKKENKNKLTFNWTERQVSQIIKLERIF